MLFNLRDEKLYAFFVFILFSPSFIWFSAGVIQIGCFFIVLLLSINNFRSELKFPLYIYIIWFLYCFFIYLFYGDNLSNLLLFVFLSLITFFLLSLPDKKVISTFFIFYRIFYFFALFSVITWFCLFFGLIKIEDMFLLRSTEEIKVSNGILYYSNFSSNWMNATTFCDGPGCTSRLTNQGSGEHFVHSSFVLKNLN